MSTEQARQGSRGSPRYPPRRGVARRGDARTPGGSTCHSQRAGGVRVADVSGSADHCAPCVTRHCATLRSVDSWLRGRLSTPPRRRARTRWPRPARAASGVCCRRLSWLLPWRPLHQASSPQPMGPTRRRADALGCRPSAPAGVSVTEHARVSLPLSSASVAALGRARGLARASRWRAAVGSG